MIKKEKSLLRQLIDERGIKDIACVQDHVKELTSGLIKEIMDAENEDELGYNKYDAFGFDNTAAKACQGMLLRPIVLPKCLLN